jgi:hypothetical protein
MKNTYSTPLVLSDDILTSVAGGGKKHGKHCKGKHGKRKHGGSVLIINNYYMMYGLLHYCGRPYTGWYGGGSCGRCGNYSYGRWCY